MKLQETKPGDFTAHTMQLTEKDRDMPSQTRQIAKRSLQRFDHYRRRIETLLPRIPSLEARYRGSVYDLTRLLYECQKHCHNELLAWVKEAYGMGLEEWLTLTYAPVEAMLGPRSRIFEAVAEGVPRGTFVSYGAANALAMRHGVAAKKRGRSAIAARVDVPALPDKAFTIQEREARHLAIIASQRLAIGELRQEVRELRGVIRKVGQDNIDLVKQHRRELRTVEKRLHGAQGNAAS